MRAPARQTVLVEEGGRGRSRLSRRGGGRRRGGGGGRSRSAGGPAPVARAVRRPAVLQDCPLARTKSPARQARARGGDLVRADLTAARPCRGCHGDDAADTENGDRQDGYCPSASHCLLLDVR